MDGLDRTKTIVRESTGSFKRMNPTDLTDRQGSRAARDYRSRTDKAIIGMIVQSLGEIVKREYEQ